jgi:hypothetical protein
MDSICVRFGKSNRTGAKGESKEKSDRDAFTTIWNRIFDLVAPKLIGWCLVHKSTRDVASILQHEASRQVSIATQWELVGLTEFSLYKFRNQSLALELILVEKERDEGTPWLPHEIEK